MLSAVDAHGRSVVLAGPEAKSLAIHLKEIPHFCPQCGGSLIVKAGDVNIPHFAHTSQSSCDSFSEHESPRHLAGKADLFQWITTTADAKMEARLPDGSQRPDILSGKIAVEFQCSTISAALFKERTDKYTTRGMTPFWIYGGKPVERKGSYIKLTPFQRLFLRYHPQLGFYFISYCPDRKGFTVYGRIIPVTPSLCAAERRFIKMKDMSFPPSAEVKGKHAFSLNAFFDEKRKWMDRALYFQNARRHPFFKAVYAEGRNPYLLPEQIGLPVRSGMAIRNHPAEWQFYILMDWKKRPAEETVRQRIELGHLKEQLLPLADGMTAETAAKEYTALLYLLGEENLTDSTSMGAKLQNEKAFMNTFSATVISKLIF
ncbi:competence protein CoiA [Domibacillus tundrae]|uniref:competence protein CoiA n=1 Tax=Domibacillus tundrae TaxID=1587527 RepID=UPI0033914BE7